MILEHALVLKYETSSLELKDYSDTIQFLEMNIIQLDKLLTDAKEEITQYQSELLEFNSMKDKCKELELKVASLKENVSNTENQSIVSIQDLMSDFKSIRIELVNISSDRDKYKDECAMITKSKLDIEMKLQDIEKKYFNVYNDISKILNIMPPPLDTILNINISEPETRSLMQPEILILELKRFQDYVLNIITDRDKAIEDLKV